MRIAMWSGPRSLSTAMMRAWGQRGDTWVVDEPLYAHWLQESGVQHPGRAKILATGEIDAQRVVENLLGPIPHGRRVFYQKHMAAHLTNRLSWDWMDALTHGFLIRHPADLLASYTRVVQAPALEDLGLPQLVELFDRAADRLGQAPPVVDAADVRKDPEGALRSLCCGFGVSFDAAMLCWPAGPRDTDGVWAPQWYASVERSTGFAPWTPRERSVEPRLKALYDRAMPLYERLSKYAWKADNQASS